METPERSGTRPDMSLPSVLYKKNDFKDSLSGRVEWQRQDRGKEVAFLPASILRERACPDFGIWIEAGNTVPSDRIG